MEWPTTLDPAQEEHPFLRLAKTELEPSLGDEDAIERALALGWYLHAEGRDAEATELATLFGGASAEEGSFARAILLPLHRALAARLAADAGPATALKASGFRPDAALDELEELIDSDRTELADVALACARLGAWTLLGKRGEVALATRLLRAGLGRLRASITLPPPPCLSIERDDELRDALLELAERCETRPARPATRAALDRAEKELGFALPAWVRRVLGLMNGFRDGPLLGLGGEPGIVATYRMFRESCPEVPGEWAGGVLVPFYEFEDGDGDVFHRETGAIRSFAHDEGPMGPALGLEAWLKGLLREETELPAPYGWVQGGSLSDEPSWRAKFGRARVAAEAARGGQAFRILDVLRGIPGLLDEPEQPGDWTARVDPAPPDGVQGTFCTTKGRERRELQGVVRNGLLRIRPVPDAPPPAWSKGDIVVARP